MTLTLPGLPSLAAHAALLFLEGQYALYHDTNGEAALKMLSPASVGAAFGKIPADSGWLAPAVRRWGHTPTGEYAVMFIPAGTYPLRLTNDETIKNDAGKKYARLNIPLPALAFAGRGTAYAVWACAESEPAPTATAYHAPLPNVHPDGAICFGENHPPKASPATIQAAWELFIASPFNGHLARGKSRAHADDVRLQLRTLAARGKVDTSPAAYPVRDLVSCRTTIDRGVSRFLGHREADNAAWDAEDEAGDE
jgi:hypothetical protein